MYFTQPRIKVAHYNNESRKIEATADAEEDAEYGPHSLGDELPAELQRREERLRRIREAKRALQERARAEAEAEGKGKEEQGKVKPAPKAQYNFTDPESRILKGPELADNGYLSEENLQGAAKMQVEAYVAAGKQKHSQIVSPCPRGPIPQSATALERMRRKLQTIIGRKIYARRKAIVEPVFGQIKHRQGFRQFLLRGVNKVRGEWALVCMTHNILKLHRACCT
jgi:hypothetical protein